MPSKFKSYFITGLIVMLPVAVSLYIFWLLFAFIDQLTGSLIKLVFGRTLPGLGLLVTLAVILLVGFLATNIIGKFLIRIGDWVMYRIPLLKSIYRTSKQVIDTIWAQREKTFREVVMIEYPRKGIYAVAFLTGRIEGKKAFGLEEEMATVFLPTTPNPTSGFLLLLPRKDIISLDISVEEGIKFVISGGVVFPSFANDDYPPVYKRKEEG